MDALLAVTPPVVGAAPDDEVPAVEIAVVVPPEEVAAVSFVEPPLLAPETLELPLLDWTPPLPDGDPPALAVLMSVPEHPSTVASASSMAAGFTIPLQHCGAQAHASTENAPCWARASSFTLVSVI
jgi:hypothetical protein